MEEGIKDGFLIFQPALHPSYLRASRASVVERNSDILTWT